MLGLLLGLIGGMRREEEEREGRNPPEVIQPKTGWPTMEPGGKLGAPRAYPPGGGLVNIPPSIEGAKERELLLLFPDDPAYERFLRRVAGVDGLRVLGRLDRIRTVRVAYDSSQAVQRLGELSAESTLSRNYRISVPSQAGELFQRVAAEAVPFGKDWPVEWLEWPGIDSQWGEGVIVAVLDSGISPHPTLPGQPWKSVDLIGDGSVPHGHGTAVASVIAGRDERAPGLAPAVRLLDVRVLDEQGVGTSFSLAAGILAAVDGGAQVINLSLGGAGWSPVVMEAIARAREVGAVVIAASGNEGEDRVAFPASQDGVLAVAAVDAQDRHLAFSNQGPEVDVAAPGWGLWAGWPGGGVVEFSGTSVATAFVSGAVAVVLSQNPGMKPFEAVDLLLAHANEAGLPGRDTAFGHGVISLRRVLQAGQRGVRDLAVAGLAVRTNPGGVILEVMVQNRGNEPLTQSQVRVQVNQARHQWSVAHLSPGQVKVLEYPVSLAKGQELQIEAAAEVMSGSDAFPHNDLLSSRWRLLED